MMALSGLYLITDRRACGTRSLADLVRGAIAGGLRLLQYREKELPNRERFEVARLLRDLTAAAGVTLMVNDDVDLTLAVGADGLHLGQEDLPLPVARKILGPHKIIGISTRDIEAAKQATRDGADYLAAGPVFVSPTKQVRPPLGCAIIRELRQVTNLPLFGIGGIDLTNACEVIRAGADGVAVVSSLCGAPNITEATRDFLNCLEHC